MKHTFTIRFLTIVISIPLAFLSSCRSSSSTLTPTSTLSVSPSTESTVTPSLPKPRPTNTPTFVSHSEPVDTKALPKGDTELDTPTVVPKFTKTPIATTVPLPKEGPWLIYLISYDVPPLLCNLNGSGCVPVNMPVKSWG